MVLEDAQLETGKLMDSPEDFDAFGESQDLLSMVTQPSAGVPQKNTRQRYISSVLEKDPGELVDFLDFPKVRQRLYDNTLDALHKRFPLYNDRYVLSLEDVAYDDPADFSLKTQKKALLEGSSVGRRIRGSWVLSDINTGKVVSKTPRKTILKVPYLTERGTFIKKGSEFTFSSIMRMEPGIYTKKRDDEISAQFNPRQGSGTRINMVFTPSSGLFRFQKGTINAPAYKVLHDYGISDEQLQQAWGKELFEINKKAAQDQRAARSAERFYNERA